MFIYLVYLVGESTSPLNMVGKTCPAGTLGEGPKRALKYLVYMYPKDIESTYEGP